MPQTTTLSPIPISTYRVQLHHQFPLRKLMGILDYIEELGVDTLYLSPLFKAVPGSEHGYDVVDPHSINPEIGTWEEVKTLSQQLHQRGLSWLQDIVPNHMAYSTHNMWLMDVWQRGPKSPYYTFFDIDWQHPDPLLYGKVMVPFLSTSLEDALSDGRVALCWKDDQGWCIQAETDHYPLSLPAWYKLQTQFPDVPMTGWGDDNGDLASWHAARQLVVERLQRDAVARQQIRRILDEINSHVDRLQSLLDQQYYQLTYWKDASEKINYRRFFTVNTLICLRMEDDNVFDAYHQTLGLLEQQHIIQGLRIDHIDGLFDPTGYVRKLRQRFPGYIIAEKILEAHEDMPGHWPVSGTSGYEFLSCVNQLFTHRAGARRLQEFYKAWAPRQHDYTTMVWNNKQLILEQHMRGEWDNLVRLFFSLPISVDIPRDTFSDVLKYWMLGLPVYRIYVDTLPLPGETLMCIRQAFLEARRRADHALLTDIDRLEALMTAPVPEHPEDLIFFLRRVMQFTGPLTAKGVEDTTFYVYNPLISHDEVGDTPEVLGIAVSTFHEKMMQRQRQAPHALNATATHDTKRGEDARIRLNVLSELPAVWEERVTRWRAEHGHYKTTVAGKTMPEDNDVYFIYQSMVGGFPADGIVTESWFTRLSEYWIKALREAKVNSRWESPDETYEEACLHFLHGLLTDTGFVDSLRTLVQQVAVYAQTYSLGQVLIKATAPGIPDTYQGGALWDLSFVDPDNRRAVDYDVRKRVCRTLDDTRRISDHAVLQLLQQHRHEGWEKLYVTRQTLHLRRHYAELFAQGDYIPLSIMGNIISGVAYARHWQQHWVIVVVPLNLVAFTHHDRAGETMLIFPDAAPRRWYHVFTGQYHTWEKSLPLTTLWQSFPVALLVSADNDINLE